MKRSRTLYEARSPHSNESQLQYPAITAIQQHLALNSQTSDFQSYCDDSLDYTQNFDPLYEFLGSNAETYDAEANTSNQYDFASVSGHGQRNISQQQQSLPQRSEGNRCGIINYAESSGLIGARHEVRSAVQFFPGACASPYNTRGRSCSAVSQRSAVTPMPNHPAATAGSTEARLTLYSPYRGRFADSDAARDHRHLSTRFGRQPYILPEDDDTIRHVECDRHLHVGRIYDAMVCGDRAQDNPGSIAMKRWVNGAHYNSDLIEAFAHKVFDCLLVQVKEGFRGWHHNDYVDDDRKGEKEDREADCANRLENIIDALEREKTVCEDVVNSASQIRMFVNAPIAYAQRKVQNRQGNSKRGRTKDTSDSNPRPSQRRRIGARRSIATPDRPMSRDTSPQFQMPASTGMPHYASGSSNPLPPSPMTAYLGPRQHLQRPVLSMPQAPPGYRPATTTALPSLAQAHTSPPSTQTTTAMSRPKLPASRPYNTPTTRMPTQASPMAPTPSSHPYPTSASPDDAKCPPKNSPADWSTVETFASGTPIDPSLTSSDLLFAPDTWPDGTAADLTSTSGFDAHAQPHVSLAEIEQGAPQTEEDPVAEFEALWNEIPGVQRFAFEGFGEGEGGEY